MKIHEAWQNLLAPTFDDFKSRCFNALNVFSQATASDHLSYQDNLLFFFIVPSWYKVNDVLVLKFLDEIYFTLYTNSILFRKTIKVYDIPCHFHACFDVDSPINYLVSATTELLAEPLKPTLRRDFHNLTLNTHCSLILLQIFLILLFLAFLLILRWVLLSISLLSWMFLRLFLLDLLAYHGFRLLFMWQIWLNNFGWILKIIRVLLSSSLIKWFLMCAGYRLVNWVI
jgi:hypothetical protein